MKTLSFVIPVYNSESSLNELCSSITSVMRSLDFEHEILLIDDCSTDGSWETIKKLSIQHKKIKGLKLSRNFGQHNAITAGIDKTEGDWVVFMDCDLQDDPNELPKFIKYTENDSNIIIGKRMTRKDTLFKKAGSHLFTYIFNFLGDIDYDNSSSNYIMCSRKVIEASKSLKEQTRNLPLHLLNLGFNRKFVEIQHKPRKYGKSSYSLLKLLNLASDSIISNSNKPLIISIKLGIILSVFSIFFSLYTLIHFLSGEIGVPGWTTLIILITLISGLGFINMGIIGLYIGKIYNELKSRPIYIIEEII